MFYLKFFYNTFLNHRISGICLALGISLNFLLLCNHNSFKNFLHSKLVNENHRIYFQSIYSGSKSPSEIIIKMKSLPGVKAAFQSDASDKINEIKSEFKENGVYLPSFLFKEKVKLIEVELVAGLNKKNHNLIREYFIKYLATDTPVTSSIYYPDVDKFAMLERQKTIDLIFLSILGALFLALIFSVYHFGSKLILRAFIVERFQRKSLVGEKSFINVLIISLIPLFLFQFFVIKESTFAGIFLFLSIVVVFSVFSLIQKKSVSDKI